MAKSIFNQESEDRVELAERINEYIRVPNSGVRLIVLAVALVAFSLLVWGVLGTIPVTSTFKGIVDSDNDYDIDVVVDAAHFSGKNLVGKEANFTMPDGTKGMGVIVNASTAPFSKEELRDILGDDFLTDSLVSSAYSYVLDLKPDIDLSAYDLQISDVLIITAEQKPIYFLSD